MVCTKVLLQYATTWNPVLSEMVTGDNLFQFIQNLIQLRNMLSCSVCHKVMTIKRKALHPNTCEEHFVCLGCKGMERGAEYKCKECEDWTVFEEDHTLNLLLKNYAQFCFYLLITESFVRVLEVKEEVDSEFNSSEIIDLLGEGIKGFNHRTFMQDTDPKNQQQQQQATTTTCSAASTSTSSPGVVPVGNGSKKKKKNKKKGKNGNGGGGNAGNTSTSTPTSTATTTIGGGGRKEDFIILAPPLPQPLPRSIPSTPPQSQPQPKVSKPSTPAPTSGPGGGGGTQKGGQGQAKKAPEATLVAVVPTVSKPSSHRRSSAELQATAAAAIKAVSNAAAGCPSVPFPFPPVSMSHFGKAPAGKLVLVDASTVATSAAGTPKGMGGGLGTSSSAASASASAPVSQTPTVPAQVVAPTASTATAAVRMITPSGTVTSPITISQLQQSLNTSMLRMTTPGGVVKTLPLRLGLVQSPGAITLPGGQTQLALQVIGHGPTTPPQMPKATTPTVSSSSTSKGKSTTTTTPKQRVIVPTTISYADLQGKFPLDSFLTLRKTDGSQNIRVTQISNAPNKPTTSTSAADSNATTANVASRTGSAQKAVSTATPATTTNIKATTVAVAPPPPATSSVVASASSVNLGKINEPKLGLVSPFGGVTVPAPKTSAAPIPTQGQSQTHHIIPASGISLPTTMTGQPIIIDAASLGQGFASGQGLGSLPTGTIIAQSSGLGGVMITAQKKSDCKCGSTASTMMPANLICIGQRCACYANGNACLDCKCTGCKNPYIPVQGIGAKKILRAVPISDSQTQSQNPNASQTISLHGSMNSCTISSAAPTSTATAVSAATIFAGNQSQSQGQGMAPLMATISSSGGTTMPTSSGASYFLPMAPLRFTSPTGYPHHQVIQIAGSSQGFPIIFQQALRGATLQGTPNVSGGITLQGLQLPASSIAGGFTTTTGFPVAHVQAQGRQAATATVRVSQPQQMAPQQQSDQQKKQQPQK